MEENDGALERMPQEFCTHEFEKLELSIVTSDHHILIHRGLEQQTIPAGNLRIGDIVLCTGSKQRLVRVEHTEDPAVQVYQITFMPNAPMETCFHQGAIPTKGFKRQV